MSYEHRGDDDQLTIRFRMWYGLIRYSISVPVLTIDEETASLNFKEETDSQVGHSEKEKKLSWRRILYDLRQFERFLKHVHGFYKITRRFLRKMTVKHFSWETAVGLDDAALTAQFSGLLWSIKGNIFGLMAHYMRVKSNPTLSVNPIYQGFVSKTRLSCMLSFRIGYAMIAGLQVLLHGRRWFLNKKKSQGLNEGGMKHV